MFPFLNPIPIKLLPLMTASILNVISVTCYMPQAFKVAKIKPLLKKPALAVLAVLVR